MLAVTNFLVIKYQIQYPPFSLVLVLQTQRRSNRYVCATEVLVECSTSDRWLQAMESVVGEVFELLLWRGR